MNNNTNRQVFVVGLDGAPWSLLDRLTDQDSMPYLKQLLKEGCKGTLKSTIPPLSPVAWASFLTGVNPGKHGIFDFFNVDRKNWTKSKVNSASLKTKTVYEYLGQKNKKTISLNIPMTYPVFPVNGILISGALAPGLACDFTYPTEFRKELLKAVPNYKIMSSLKHFRTSYTQVDGFTKELIEVVRMRFEAVMFLIQNHDWDFFAVNFMAVDQLLHPFWGYLDPNHKFYDKEKFKIIKTFFQELDNLIAKIHQKLNGNVLKLIMSDHGFRGYQHIVDINVYLKQRGLMKNKARVKTIKPAIKQLLRRIDYFDLRSHLRKYIIKREDAINIDLAQTLAFDPGSKLYAEIYLTNQSAKARTLQALEELSAPENNNPVVEKVYQPSELYPGKEPGKAADFILKPTKEYVFWANDNAMPKNKTFRGPRIGKDFQIGTHDESGIMLWNGNNIKTNQRIDGEIADIAPTLLYHMGLPIPSYMEGEVLSDVFTEGFRKSNPVLKQTDDGHRDIGKSFYSSREDQVIQEQLQALGYIE